MNNTRLFVSNLPLTITTTDLKGLFAKYGNVKDAYVPMDRITKKPKGIAFVEMSTASETSNAMSKLNRYSFKGKNISISIAKERTESAPTTSASKFNYRDPKGLNRGTGNFRPGMAPRYSNSNQSNKRSFGKYIDPSLFVNKAKEGIETPEYVSTHKFIDFALDDKVKENITKMGYVNPTPIQDQAIKFMLEGKDIIGVANTGTGKTAAFLLPLITKILKDKRQKALIIAPTRELAAQINDQLVVFAKDTFVRSALCIGGANMNNQIMQLRRFPNLVIGTPGRIMDLAKTKKLYLNEFQNIVLDEVDRMLDMGFIDDIQKMLSFLPKERQSFFFSATMPEKVSSLAKGFLIDPVTISVKTRETAENIDQDVIHVNGQDKMELLHDLLRKNDYKKVLVFGKTKRNVEKLSNELEKRGFKSASIHGDKTQARRQQALNLFKKDIIQILVATDVAARGLDISDVSHVINYDLPQSYEDYIHRIGRTGRANKKGSAITFLG